MERVTDIMGNAEQDALLRQIAADLAVVAANVRDHHATLYGNGHPGLRADVQRLDIQQQTCPARLAAGTDRLNLRAVWWGVALAAVSAAVSAAATIAQLLP